MKVLLTGGSGDLGRTLVPRLLDMGHTPVILDVRAPRDLKQGAVFIEGSILSAPHACSWISPDSPLEEAVTSELVSAQFPVIQGKYREFHWLWPQAPESGA